MQQTPAAAHTVAPGQIDESRLLALLHHTLIRCDCFLLHFVFKEKLQEAQTINNSKSSATFLRVSQCVNLSLKC